tara:strand:- start:117 stop:494 length:378 start_codon:yes stop_codon:yes gene_type:complete
MSSLSPTTLCLGLLVAAASALRVPCVAMSGATRLGATDSRPGSVPEMYRERWEDEPAVKAAGKPADLLSSHGNRDGLAAVRDAADEACLVVEDKEVICGEMSFDSTDEMTCIQDPESESVKWICS